jgi:hypothetical protein
MLSSVLKSKRAVQVNVEIMRSLLRIRGPATSSGRGTEQAHHFLDAAVGHRNVVDRRSSVDEMKLSPALAKMTRAKLFFRQPANVRSVGAVGVERRHSRHDVGYAGQPLRSANRIARVNPLADRPSRQSERHKHMRKAARVDSLRKPPVRVTSDVFLQSSPFQWAKNSARREAGKSGKVPKGTSVSAPQRTRQVRTVPAIATTLV